MSSGFNVAEKCASIKPAEEIVSGMSLSPIKAELKKRGLPVKEKKASLMARLIVVLKQAENLSLRVRKVEVRNRLLQFLHKLYKETGGLQHQLVTIYRRSLLIRR